MRQDTNNINILRPVKVPQIINIVKGKSAEGVSLMATLQELVTYSITLSRSYRRQLPFRLE